MGKSEGPHVIKNEEKAIAARRLQESCFLMDNWPIFYAQAQEFKYKHFVQAIGNPNQFITRMVTKDGKPGLMQLTPAQLSYLVPRIRLFKVYYPTEDSKGEDVELHFEDFMSPESVAQMTTDRAGRGAGCGIKSFEWTLAGTNPAEADKNIEAKLKIYMQSMEDLLTVRTTHKLKSGAKQEVRFIDLIQRVGKFDKREGRDAYNKKYFKIKAMIGWAVPKSHIDAAGVRTDGTGSSVEYLNSATGTLTLTLVSHKIDLKEHGAVELELDYIAYMEGVLSHPDADVLLLGDEENRVKERRANIKGITAAISDINAMKKCGDIDDESAKDITDELKEDRDEIREELREDLSISYKRFIGELMNSKRVFSIKIPQAEIGLWQESWSLANLNPFSDAGDPKQLTSGDAAKARGAGSGRSEADLHPAWANSIGSFANASEVSAEAGKQIDEWAKKGKIDSSEFAEEYDDDQARSGKEYVLNYFYYGALIDIALSVLYADKQSVVAEVKAILGPLQFTDPRTGLEETICLSDVPISLNMFMIWFMDKVVKKQKEQFFVKDFVKQSIAALISPALGTKCWGVKAGNPRTRIGLRMLNAPAMDDGTDRIKPGTKEASDFGNHKINSDNPGDIGKYPTEENMLGLISYDYAFWYAASQKFDKLNGNEEEDLKKGIYHLKIGADKGLLKKVTFKKEDAPGLKEAKMVGESSPLLQSRELYNADVDLYGNSLWVPGSMIFINPTSFLPTPAGKEASEKMGGTGDISRDIGIGGYYMVNKVQSSIEAGKFETSLETIWQADGSGNPGSGRQGKCDEGDSKAPVTSDGQTPKPGEGPGIGDAPPPGGTKT